MRLHSNIIGEGKPFLILHGFLGMSDNWKTLGKEFADAGYQVHLIDQRNHGRSPHSNEFNYLVMAKDIKEYCDLHNLEDVILLGHSMGGKTAMLAASLFPHVVGKLIVVDIAPKYYAPHHQQILKGLKAIDDASLTSRGEADELLQQYVDEVGVRMFLLKNLYWKSKEKLGLRMNLDVLAESGEDIGEALPDDKKFTKPTLFIKGAKSGYITSGDEALIKSQFPEAQITEIPESGHWVHAEKKVAFYDAVMKFL